MEALKRQETIEFLKSKNNLFRNWQECRGHVCEIEGVALSMDKAPPPLAHPSPHVAAATREVPARKRRQERDPWLNLYDDAVKVVEAKRAFFDWLESPPPKPQASPPASRVPPFDIQDVPKAMDKLSMPMAAKLQRRWFAGYENYSRSPTDLKNEIDQHGARYAPSMVDDTTIKMEWVLHFPRAKEAFAELIEDKVRNADAIQALKLALMPYSSRPDVTAWNETKGDFLKFHQQFQFQRQDVNRSWGERISNFLDRSINAEGVPDDLTGALGTFNFYAAVDFARINRQKNEASVSYLWVYVRDPYEFSDEQYLGHWSASHVAVVPAHQIAMAAGKPDWLKYLMVHGDVYTKGNVLYPVTNKDYRDWRARHKQGGDFMIYSDRMPVRINPPIRVPL